jgi:hypothetical protein
MVSGSMNGKTGSFTMTMPMGSMMSTGGGPFDHGQMSMVHQSLTPGHSVQCR